MALGTILGGFIIYIIVKAAKEVASEEIEAEKLVRQEMIRKARSRRGFE